LDQIEAISSSWIELFQMNQQLLVNGYFESTADFWREIYERSDIGSRVYQARYRTVLARIDRLRIPAGSRVLEVGCGAGHTTIALARRGFVVEALDAAQAMADQTREHVEQSGLSNQVRTGVGDVYRLPYRDGEFRLVVAIGVLPWLADRDAAVREMQRVTAPGGHLLLTMDNSMSFSRWLDPSLNPLLLPLKRRLARLIGQPAARANFCSNRTIDRTLLRQGLRKAWSSTVGFGPFSFFNRPILRGEIGEQLHERLQAMANRNVPVVSGAGSHYLVLAQKNQ
jgi:ubiquinone/menaquinone biosynthesis C-methylase UbiE